MKTRCGGGCERQVEIDDATYVVVLKGYSVPFCGIVCFSKHNNPEMTVVQRFEHYGREGTFNGA